MAVKIGLTGGIGSGKSTVAKIFQSLNVTTIDADKIADEFRQPGCQQYHQIVELFGSDIVDSRNEIDRKKLGEIVFNDKEKRQALEAILHPAIRNSLHERSRKAKGAYVILEIPLLIETGQWKEMERVVVVCCDADIRTQRLLQSRQISKTKIQQILNAQLSDEQRTKHADYIINNDSDFETLKKQVENVHHSLLRSLSRSRIDY